MSCFGDCFKGPAAAGVRDAGKPGAALIKVRLSTGQQVPVHVLPTDTMRTVKRKVEAVHGVQPEVAVKHKLVPPFLCARFEGKWLAAAWEATMADIGMQELLKFSDISDELNKMNKLVHAHWAVSNALALGGGLSG